METLKGLIESEATIRFAISGDKVGVKMPANKTNLTGKIKFLQSYIKRK